MLQFLIDGARDGLTRTLHVSEIGKEKDLVDFGRPAPRIVHQLLGDIQKEFCQLVFVIAGIHTAIIARRCDTVGSSRHLDGSTTDRFPRCLTVS